MFNVRLLEEAGLDYVRARLASGKTLSLLVREQIAALQGYAWSYLPSTMSDEQAKRFTLAGVTRSAAVDMAEAGGLWEAVRNLSEPWLATVLERFLRHNKSACAVFEDPEALSTDASIDQRPWEPLKFFEREVYYWLTPHNANQSTIRSGLAVMSPWYGSPGVFAVLPQSAEHVAPGAALTREHLGMIASHVQVMCFLAYDGEGYVFWSRADPYSAGFLFA